LEEQLLQLFIEVAVESEDIFRVFPARFDPAIAVIATSTSVANAAHISEIEDPDTADWDRYVQNHPQASLYHQYIWRNVIRESFGHPTFYLVARDTGRKICGVLPLIRLRSFLFGDFAVSMPFFNYGGVLADSTEIAQQLLTRAAELAQANNLQHLEIREMQTVNGWPTRTDKVSMIRRLPATQEELDEELGAKVRAQIKRARQENIQIRAGHLDLLDEFYHVFAINMRDLGTPVYGKNFFRSILIAQPDHAHIVTVHMNNKPVAAAFLLGYRDMMEIPWASTLRSANAAGINMVLYREVLKLCIDKKYAFFDFGRSSKDSGTYRFKKQWGAQPLQHYWHYWLQDGGPLPELKPDSPKFRLLIAVWQRLPVAISKLLGPMIVKYLP